MRAIDNELSGKFRLNADINLSDYGNWKPIGKQDIYDGNVSPFTGIFDGNGHSISGMHISNTSDLPAQDQENIIYSISSNTSFTFYTVYAGLFGMVEGATIKNLMIYDSSINLRYNTYYDNNNRTNLNTFVYAGTLIGMVNFINSGSSNDYPETVVENIYVKNSSINTQGNLSYNGEGNASVKYSLGGVIGHVYRSTLKVRNCMVVGSNSSLSSTIAQTSFVIKAGALQRLGGIVGYLYNAIAEISNCVAQVKLNCFHSCNWYKGGAREDVIKYIIYMGGIVGYSSATLSINRCISDILPNSTYQSVNTYTNPPTNFNYFYYQPLIGQDGSREGSFSMTNCYYVNNNSSSYPFHYTDTNKISDTNSGTTQIPLSALESQSMLDFLNGYRNTI